MREAIQTLVIGYGNELRGDDAAGPRVAEAVAGWRLDGVRAVTVPQLTPELSEVIAAARAVIFADAALDASSNAVQVHPLEACQDKGLGSHCVDPRSLLALAQALYGKCPPAWLVTVPARDFAIGEPLSEHAQRGLREALECVRQLCGPNAAPA
jgi:hydrogenase maturation protease